eukprot:TRINITY_DN1179_c0_g1_i1.p2 TRINITY_DN1179_c0_g1~~TRINITY_DN1179_c0_g1_i1.p2  ORF type:complete len:145 (+),score=38.41 TRINITY_DN1179_c0_g1_i1:28-435(+)
MATTAPPAKRPAIFVKINDLKPGTHGHNLKVKVVKSAAIVEKTRTDGTKIRIAECTVGDETGCVVLTARNEQIDVVQPGKSIIVRNSKIDMFKGFMRLAVDKWGKIETSPEQFNIDVKLDNNLSLIEYELVTVNE